MHPAPSLIAFTTLSGFGFGLMAWLGAGLGPGGTPGLLAALLALGTASAGLLASLAHLGNPQRAWRALSQWRSSWLSREGVAAIATLAAFTAFAAAQALGRPVPALGWLAAALALATVLCTAMIYAQLRTVPRWNTPLTPAVFMLFALTGPAILLGHWLAALGLTVALFGVQMAHWTIGAGAMAARGHGVAGATGLSGWARGAVRALEPPHTGRNYLMDEMIFRLARKRAGALRRAAILLAFALPCLWLAMVPALGWPWVLGGMALAAHAAGAVATRWLFFAEAEHVVGLYYPVPPQG
jgi:sulfite dehydrogenase (quinone) subunit SoeC